MLYKEAPKYNEKRRGTLTTFRRRVRQVTSVQAVFGALPESATDPSMSSFYFLHLCTVLCKIIVSIDPSVYLNISTCAAFGTLPESATDPSVSFIFYSVPFYSSISIMTLP